MSSSTAPAPIEGMPAPAWLEGPHGRLAFFAYPAPQPWLHVLVSHGFAEHSGWWHHVAVALQAAGVSAYLFDHYHHGHSAGAAADVPDFSHLVAGLRTVLDDGVAPHLGGTPLVLLGHSNGGLVSVLALAERPPEPVQGVVLSSPFLGMPPLPAVAGTALARLLRLFGPRRRVPLPVRPWRLTGDRALWPRYRADPLRFSTITVRFFLAMRRALRAARGCTDLHGRPLLLLSAGREVVVSPRAMQRWFTRAVTPDKMLHHYPTLCHELFNETRWEDVLADVLAWARERFGEADGELARPAAN